MVRIDSPSRRREGARAAMRELVRVAHAVLPLVPREAELPRWRLRSALDHIRSLAGPVDAPADFDEAFREPMAEAPAQGTTAVERQAVAAAPHEAGPDLVARLARDADALAASLARQAILESRLAEAADRESGLYDGRDMFDRLRINERRPVVRRDLAMDPEHLRQVVASLDAAGMRKAADTLVWAAWHYERAWSRAESVDGLRVSAAE